TAAWNCSWCPPWHNRPTFWPSTVNCQPSTTSRRRVGAIPYNIILSQIRPRLHLDDVQRNLSRVLDAVLHAERDECGLILFQQERLVSARHAGGAGDDDPVLGAMVMHLHRDRCARLDRHSIDTEALAGVDLVIAAPGSVDLATY